MMDRFITPLFLLAFFATFVLMLACGRSDVVAGSSGTSGEKGATEQKGSTMTDKVTKSDKEWRAILTPEQYRVAREKGTERAFTGKFWDNKEAGVYTCVCCGNELFSSGTKFESGTGWPSFYAPFSESKVSTERDRGLLMERTEVLCARCDAHLGHVFEDGPKPTGLRYCVNSASLDFVEEGKRKEKNNPAPRTPGMHRAIQLEVEVEADVDAAWKAWTTEEGIKSFFAPGCNVDLRVDGLYEIYFLPEAPPGQRGGDGMRILAIQPKKMFSFTWNAPPSLPEVRKQRTHVTLHFREMAEGKTKVSLVHDGWGEGEEWDKAFEYFSSAWKDVVLPRLQYRFSEGPVDWKNPPSFK